MISKTRVACLSKWMSKGAGKVFCCSILLLAVLACSSSDVDFRRFEVGDIDPKVVLDTAVEVVKDFYTNVHGGITLFVDEDNMSLQTDYVQKRTALDEGSGRQATSISMERLKRQKLFLKVLPGRPVEIEILATYEILAFEDPDALKTEDDLWFFVKQDAQMEELVFDQLLKRLVEKELLD